jgi:hypothetical protein
VYQSLHYRKEKSNNWKGGVSTVNGYTRSLTPEGIHEYDHRLIAKEILGRPLKSKEFIHHINGNRADNRPKNLKICSSIKEHIRYHLGPRGPQKNPHKEKII